MRPGDGQLPEDSRSFFGRLAITLGDLRLWAILLPTFLLSGLVLLFLGPRIATALTLVIGLAASYLISQLEKLPTFDGISIMTGFYHRALLPGLVGVLAMQGTEIFSRVWLVPWYWFHPNSEFPSCWLLMCGIVSDWLGFLLCGAVLGTVLGRRATYAATVGMAIYFPVAVTMIFTGISEQALAVLGSSCKFLGTADPSDLETARYGMAFGYVARFFLAVFTARVVSSWRAMRNPESGERA